MSITVENELATIEEATAILLEKMPASKVARLLAIWRNRAQRSQKSKDSSRREASEKTFAPLKAAGRGCWEQPSQFVEKGAEVYAKA